MHRTRRSLGVALVVVALASSACTGSSGTSAPQATRPATSRPSTPAASTSGSASRASAAASSGSADWPTYHGRADRDGVSTTMPAVRGTPHVAARLQLDGAVYASPIVAGGLTVVVTENDTAYAFDAANRQVWKRHLGTPVRTSSLPCGDIDPLGITGTPVYDAASGSVYLVTEVNAPIRHELVALDLRTGTTRWQRSVDLPGVETKAMQERGALTVTGGRVWVPFGGLDGDCGGYKGRVVGVPLGGKGAAVAYTVPTAREGGIWTPPGPSVDAAGNLLVAVGNGASESGQPYDHSDSTLQIDSAARLVDSFSPTSWPSDNEHDYDLGSQGPALVGPWVFAAGKSGNAYVLRAGHLGGIGGEVSQTSLCKSFGGTAVTGSTVFVPCSTTGVAAVRIDTTGRMHVLWRAAGTIHGSPVVGGGRVWALDTDAGVLHGLEPATGRSASATAVGTVSRFATPASRGADLLVPTLAGLTVVRTS